MKKILLALMYLSTLSSHAMAEDGQFLKWQVSVENSTSQNLQFSTHFPADWFNPDDGMQFGFPKSASLKKDFMTFSIPPKDDVAQVADIHFLTYGEDKNRGLSNHMIIFSVTNEGDKKEICKIAFIGQVKSNQARIEKVLSNDINCSTDWNDEWYKADDPKQSSPVIIIYVKKIAERQ